MYVYIYIYTYDCMHIYIYMYIYIYISCYSIVWYVAVSNILLHTIIVYYGILRDDEPGGAESARVWLSDALSKTPPAK